MHKKFDHESIEKKWQKEWKERGLYDVGERDLAKEKEYVLVEWPYPSGNLHIGHWFAFAVVDIYVRTKRMQGKQVLFPMGFDAFGLPAENAAIKRNLDPKAWTYENMAFMRSQLESMGNAFSWDKTTSSTDPEYYKWTQWMFIKFFENDIAFRGKATVNWCPGCNTVIANEQVLPDNTCNRSGDVIEKRDAEQWMLRITKYADRLIDSLDTLDWPEHIKESQLQWIGRSKGAELTFPLSTGDSLTVFTTRPDTLFGATYVVLAPEHELVLKNKDLITNWIEVETYIKEASQKDEIDRTNANKEKTGVQLQGITATNPATGEEIPVYIADYVLKGYGSGAIMAVPAHDERDFAFATKFGLKIQQVIAPLFVEKHNPPKEGLKDVRRDTILVFLRDTVTDTYALLDWHKTLEGITTTIMGGIEEGEDVQTAALREIAEESGITSARFVKESPWISEAKYCASHKNENRHAIAKVCLFEVDGVSPEISVAENETENHTLRWVHRDMIESSLTPPHQKFCWRTILSDFAISESGNLINSGEFTGMNSEEAKIAITTKVGGKLANTYRLRDWSIGRQRYWGVPIPIVYDPEGKAHAIPKEHLPWHLPTDVDFKPTGEAPLAKSQELKERVKRIFGKGWTPEVETMDTFVDSSWYFFRYFDNHNELELSSVEKQKEWMPIDIYFGGSEHNTMHLLYSRFWTKALYDLGLSIVDEPYEHRINRGLVLGPDGNKMSKSKGNVIDPDEQVKRLGADTVKMYLAFMGPYGEMANYPWDMGGIVGLRRFLERVYGLQDHVIEAEPLLTSQLLHRTLQKLKSDINAYKFNTAISALMIFVNTAEKSGLTKESYQIFLKLLAPFAPHLADELWHEVGNEHSVHEEAFPEADSELARVDEATIGVQVNGKMRGSITISSNATEEEAVKVALKNTAISERVGKGITKVIYKQERILNLIVSESS